MAKELPYFKFEPNEWENGNIQMFSHEEKGVFLDLCSMYWSRLGDLPYKLAVQKICGGNATALDSLYEENIYTIKEGYICIDFLNEQLMEFENLSAKNSENALKGWEKRRNNKGKDATALPDESDRIAIREEKMREDERREEEKQIEFLFDQFWNLYDKKNSKEKCFKKFKALKPEEVEKIFETLPDYIKSTPDKKFRKNAETYLNNKSWNDEIIYQDQKPNKNDDGRPQSIYDFNIA